MFPGDCIGRGEKDKALDTFIAFLECEPLQTKDFVTSVWAIVARRTGNALPLKITIFLTDVRIYKKQPTGQDVSTAAAPDE